MIEQILKRKEKQTVFTVADIAKIVARPVDDNLIANISYYVRKGDLISISKGLYALDNDYNKLELGNKLRRPSYISFYTVLQKKGIVFQEYNTIYLASNRSEEIDIDGQTYRFRKLKDEILLNTEGIDYEQDVSMAE